MSKKITFVVAADIAGEANNGLLLGEFNNWNIEEGFSLKKAKDGSLQTTVELEEGRTYQYRYLLEDGRWVNDANANDYARIHSLDVENCVITVPAAKVSGTKIKTNTKNGKEAKPELKPAMAADDLTKVEGIGKKIAELLSAAGIVTYTDLSKSTPKKIKTILAEAGSKFLMHDPATWPKQAKLAASGKWDELKALQKELKAGK